MKAIFYLRAQTILVVSLLCLISCKKVVVEENIIQYSNSWSYGSLQLSPSEYAAIPTVSIPPTGGSGTLPSNYYIEIPKYPFNQGVQGSCASCAAAMAKTIIDHTKFNIPYTNDRIIYSPSFLYNQVIAIPGDCRSGSNVQHNLEIIKTEGVCKLTEMPYNEFNCTTLPNNTQFIQATSNKIDHYFKFDLPVDIDLLKQFISRGLPIVVTFEVDNNFAYNYNDGANKYKVWDNFGSRLSPRSYHATILYGWDDSKNAFRLLNQWGNSWGDSGRIWVSYNLVRERVDGAFILQNGSAPNSNLLEVTGTLDFGNVITNTSSTKVIQLKNTGSNNINVSSITVTSPFSSNWTGGSIPPGSSQNVTITFFPTSLGNTNRTLTINSTASNNPITINASGTGTQQTSQTRIIALSGDLSFGNVFIGQSATRSLTVGNNGNSTLSVSGINTPFGYSGNWTGVIQPGQQISTSIFFNPNNVQSYPGTINVISDATSGTSTIAVSGSGVSSGGGGPTANPPIGSYGSCEGNGNISCAPSVNYGTGTINARIVSINTSTHQIIFEIKKCNGSAFNAGGNVNIVSGLCTGVSYGFGSFNSGNMTFQITATDNNMTGTKIYYPFIIQGTSLNILYSSPPIIVSY